jgi:hypothetical protein
VPRNIIGFFKEFNWRDPIERVFGVVSIGAMVVFVIFLFYDPGEVLGMNQNALRLLGLFGSVGSFWGSRVVRWSHKRGE